MQARHAWSQPATVARTLIAVLCLFLGSASAFAQTGSTGTLVGVVTDSTGAAVAGATVEVTDSGTQKVRTVTTNSDGGFIVPLLDFGSYEVKISAQNFKTYSTKDIKIEVGREYRLNAELNAGGANEIVEVSAGGASLVNANNGALSTTVNQKQILDLPLNGRNPLNLLALQAGVSSNGAQNTSINGLRTTSTNITRDGINVQDAFIRTNATDFAPQRPSVDDTAEFTITTSNADASQGYGASQIQIVTPRGTSQYHGAAFLFNRNSELGANSFFNNRAGIRLPFRNRNNYGGRIGGPVPGTKKVFFFFSFEGLKDRLAGQQNRTVLTPLTRSGGFSFTNTAGQRQTITNLLQFAQTAGIAGLPGATDPIVLSRFINPAPQGNAAGGDGFNTTGFQFNAGQNQDRNAYSTRVDYEINEKNVVTGTYTYNFESNLRPDADAAQSGNFGFNPVASVVQTSRNQLVSVAWRYTPKANLTNELRSGFFKSEVPFNRTTANPAFFVNLGVVDSPEVGFQTQGRNTNNINVQDNATWTLGNHTLSFGFQSQLFYVDAFNQAGIVPLYNIGINANTPQFAANNFTALGGISATQLNLANSLLALNGGILSSGAQTFNVESLTSGFAPVQRFQPFRYSNHAFYFQDSWRLRPNLTINAGLRYEVYPALRLENGLALEPVIPTGTPNIQQAILDPNGTYGVIGTNAGNKQYYKTDYSTVAPILSVAYSPNFKNRILNALMPGDGKTVIRGGFRQSFINDSLVTVLNNAANGNVGLGATGANATIVINGVTTNQINGRVSGTIPGVTLPVLNLNRTFAFNNSAAVGGNFGTVFAVDPNLKTPRINEFNVSFQREVGFDTAIEIRYVGNRSTNLWRGIDLNQIDIFNTGFLSDFRIAQANLAATGSLNPATVGNQAYAANGAFQRIYGSNFATLLNSAQNRTSVAQGVPGAMAFNSIVNAQATCGTLSLRANCNTGAVNLIQNQGFSSYHSLQAEIRKRFSRGLQLQANYTFGKVLTNTQGVSQQNFEPLLDNNNQGLEKARAPFDTTHAFNFNGIYELPFGKGKQFFGGSGRVLNAIIGGWQVVGILALTSGAPINIVDTTGTFQRAGRGLQTATTNLSRDQIRSLIGSFDAGARGIRFFNPVILNPGTGRASEGGGSTANFNGQVFFNAAPGATGNLGRFSINGPIFVNLDASLIKNFTITERVKFQLRFEAFNALNRTNFFVGQTQNINSAAFGQITSTFASRIVQIGGRIDF